MIKTKNTGIERAKYVMREMSLSDPFREMVEYYRKKRMDRKAEDAYVYDQGKQEGRQEGELSMLFKLVAHGKLDLQTAAEQSGMTEEEFGREMERVGYRQPCSNGSKE